MLAHGHKGESPWHSISLSAFVHGSTKSRPLPRCCKRPGLWPGRADRGTASTLHSFAIHGLKESRPTGFTKPWLNTSFRIRLKNRKC